MFLHYYSPLCEYASQFVSDNDAEELVQDMMLHIWENREYLVIEKSLKYAIRYRRAKEQIHLILFIY